MKLYEYDEFRKLNQALSSFKRNGVPIVKVDVLTVDNKVKYFVLTDPEYEPKPKPKKEEKVESKGKIEDVKISPKVKTEKEIKKDAKKVVKKKE